MGFFKKKRESFATDLYRREYAKEAAKLERKRAIQMAQARARKEHAGRSGQVTGLLSKAGKFVIEQEKKKRKQGRSVGLHNFG